jgi:hypothetical protein
MSYGKIALIIEEVEKRRTAFAVARLIMLTGLDLRAFDRTSEDDPSVLEKLRRTLGMVLSTHEVAEVEALLR